MASGAEISAILRLARQCESEKVGSALARLVSVEGSNYRRPGARMLLVEDGRSAGAISAGCLETDLRRRLPELLAGGRTEVLEYDSRSFEDLVWGLGSGCNGAVRVLLSPFAGRVRESLRRIGEILDAGRTAFVATVVCPAASSGRCAGDVIFLEGPDDKPAERGSELFVETIRPPISLLIAGAGPDAAPLARIAAMLGWTVSVLSGRDRSYVLDRFAGLGVEWVGASESSESLRVHSRSAAVVMSHGFTEDANALRILLPKGFTYLGVLGPRDRTRRLLAACEAPEDAAARLHSPAGLNIGGETAEEIALSIVSEIQTALAE